MRKALQIVAIAFLVGCNRLPTESTTTSTTPPSAPGDASPTAPPQTGQGQPSPADMGLPSSDLAPPADGSMSRCAPIDPGTQEPIVLRAVDDHDLFYVAPHLSAVMAVAKDGASAPRSLAPIHGSAAGVTAFDVAIDDTFAYYVDNGVWRVPKAGGAYVELAQPPGSSCQPYVVQRIALAPGLVWGTAFGGCTAGEPRPVYFTIDEATGNMADAFAVNDIIAADPVAVCRTGATWVLCKRTDGTYWTSDIGSGVTALALDGMHAYVGSTNGVYDAEPDGTSTLLAPSTAKVTSVATRDGLVWYASDHIYRIDPTTRVVTQLDARPASDIVVDDAYVYFQTICNLARIPR